MATGAEAAKQACSAGSHINYIMATFVFFSWEVMLPPNSEQNLHQKQQHHHPDQKIIGPGGMHAPLAAGINKGGHYFW